MNTRDRTEAVFDVAAECVADESITVRIRGGCMDPVLRDGEFAKVKRARFILPGDVVVFRTATTLVSHRAIGWAPFAGGVGIVTRGDHCERHDGVVSPRDILGRVDVRVGYRARLKAFSHYVSAIVRKVTGTR
jgi:signal peptidase I